MTTSLSKVAPSSVGSTFHSSTAFSQSSPFGAYSLPSRYSKVVSSGAMRPARAPPSIDMLHTVMRPSIESDRTASPLYSMTCPTPPPVPMRLRMPSMRSLAVTSTGSSPSTVTALGEGLGGEDVLDLARADAERQRPERPVGRRVGVAADDGEARLGEAGLRAYDVDD